MNLNGMLDTKSLYIHSVKGNPCHGRHRISWYLICESGEKCCRTWPQARQDYFPWMCKKITVTSLGATHNQHHIQKLKQKILKYISLIQNIKLICLINYYTPVIVHSNFFSIKVCVKVRGVHRLVRERNTLKIYSSIERVA